jgi:hypothetical protein
MPSGRSLRRRNRSVIEKATLAKNLGLLALQLRQAVDEETLGAYFLALRDETNAAEFGAFTAVAARRYRWEFFPSVPKILEALEEFRASQGRIGPDRQLTPTTASGGGERLRAAARTAADVEESRETARQALKAGLGTLESELSARGILPPVRRLSESAGGPPGQFARVGNSEPIRDTEERRAELWRQAGEILAAKIKRLSR